MFLKNFPKLLLVSGKGGTGKTITAKSLVHALNSFGTRAYYVDLQKSFNQAYVPGKEQDDPDLEEKNDPAIKEKYFDFHGCLLEYMTRKLKSKYLAKGICLTPFFSSLMQMLPGLRHVILMGSLFDYLEQHPDHHLVVDSWSSGHTLELVEAVFQFSQIFTIGILKKDITGVIKNIENPKDCAVLITTLLEPLIIQESMDMFQTIKSSDLQLKSYFIINEFLDLKNEKPFGQYWETLLKTQAQLFPQFKKDLAKAEGNFFNNLESLPFVFSTKEPLITSSLSAYILQHLKSESKPDAEPETKSEHGAHHD